MIPQFNGSSVIKGSINPIVVDLIFSIERAPVREQESDFGEG